MASEYLIPHPNIPTTDIGIPKVKEITVLNNENFAVLDRKAQSCESSISEVRTLADGKADSDHTHTEYADKDHTHSMQDINLLQENLDLKAPLIHTHDQYLTEVPVHAHVESEVDGLMVDLANKSNVGHTHTVEEVLLLDTALSQKAEASDLNAVRATAENAATTAASASSSASSAMTRANEAYSKAEEIESDIPSAATSAPPEISKTAGAKGTDDNYALADHTHKLCALYADDVLLAEGGDSVADALETHNESITSLLDDMEAVEGDVSTLQSDMTSVKAKNTEQDASIADLYTKIPGSAPVTSVNEKTGAVVLDADDVGALDSEDINVTVQAHSDKLDGLDDILTDDGKVPFSAIDGSMQGHSGNCLMYVNGTGGVGHVGDGSGGNTAYSLVQALCTKQTPPNKLITDKDLGNGLEADSSNNPQVKADASGGISVSSGGVAVKCATNGGLTVDADGLKLGSVGGMKTTLNLVEFADRETTNIKIRLYGLEIDENGRIVGRTSTYDELGFSPGL